MKMKKARQHIKKHEGGWKKDKILNVNKRKQLEETMPKPKKANGKKVK